MAVIGRGRVSAPPRSRRLAMRAAGAGLLAATGGIHLDLYLTGYRNIPVIGWLFLLQVIAAFGLALAVAVTGPALAGAGSGLAGAGDRLAGAGDRLAAAAGAGFALATLGGYLLSVWVGLFGFTEVRTTAGIAAGVIEAGAFAVLAFLAAWPQPAASAPGPVRAGPGAKAGRPERIPGAAPAIAAVTGIALVLLGVAAAGAGTAAAPAAAGSHLTTQRAAGVTVLATAKGLTLYWFAPDTATTSRCTGSCAAYWPPVAGPVTLAPGIPGQAGTVRRPDGSLQAAYDGHPLYTYVGDSHPGQASGNNLNLNGGLWHEVVPAG
jgi:predicted lipoprotein with Yx(FWY)xxD motif